MRLISRKAPQINTMTKKLIDWFRALFNRFYRADYASGRQEFSMSGRLHELRAFIIKTFSPEEAKQFLAQLDEISRDKETDADLAEFARRIGFSPPNQ